MLQFLLSTQYRTALAKALVFLLGQIVLLLTANFTQSKWMSGEKDYYKYAAKIQLFTPEYFLDFSIPYAALVIVSNPIFT